MKKILNSLILLGLIAAVLFGVTQAFFSDTETSQDNVLQAGSLDLKIDNESYYNGVLNPGTTWELDDLSDKLFFNFLDIKPGDWGEDTISLHVENDAWLCLNVELTENDDETCTEPEILDDNNGCNEPDDNSFDGELAQRTFFMYWPDDGDNVLEDDEFPKLVKGPSIKAFFESGVISLADSTTNFWTGVSEPILGGKTYYIGKVWCHGNNLVPQALPQDGFGADSPRTPANSTGGVQCDGSQLDNSTQTDLVKGNISFKAVQARHNPNFRCDGLEPSVSISPTATLTPTPLACGQADVMLVLDRSGSISDPELTDLKSAANAFVNALGLSTLGVHAGQSSFADTGSLDQQLTDSPASMNASINALVSGGFTNLQSGIDLANAELASARDRADGSSPDKMIVITDGHPNRPQPSEFADNLAKTSADNARADGVEVFVVGVGTDVNTSYLQTVADDVAHYYSAADYSGLQTILTGLDLCE